jgi:hypothetical protein
MTARGTRAILALALAFWTAAAAADEKKAAAAPMDEKAMMEMWQKMATPSDAHKKLDVLAGTWNVKNTMWMDPSKPPEVTEGTSENTWVLGGRYIEQRYDGKLMGQPFSGIGYTGYDNYKKKYIGTWMDTASTAILTTTGSFDKAGKILTATGKMDDFATGKVTTLREKTTFVSNDETLFEMWGPGPDGKEYKMLELRSTRKK